MTTALPTLNALCTQCGLCCDGTLFASVPLTDGEADAFETKGCALKRNGQGLRTLPQRCHALEGNRCNAYESRPTACRRYVCLLAEAVTAGEVSLSEAVGVIDQARALAGTPAGSDWLKTHFLGRSRRPF